MHLNHQPVYSSNAMTRSLSRQRERRTPTQSQLIHRDKSMSALTDDADRAPLIAVYCHVYRGVPGFRPWFQWERSVGRTLPISVITCLHSTASHQHYVLIMRIFPVDLYLPPSSILMLSRLSSRNTASGGIWLPMHIYQRRFDQ
jgi:hypothetical protein